MIYASRLPKCHLTSSPGKTTCKVPAGAGFSDMHDVISNVDFYRQGFDPLNTSNDNAAHRHFNQPRIWLGLEWLGISERHTNAIALAAIVAFFATVLLTLGRIGWSEGRIYLLALCSPAVMLGVSRGNADLIIFSLVALALLSLRRSAAVSAWIGYGLLAFAAVLKLFPIFCTVVALREPRRRALLVMAALATFFGIYIFATFVDIQLISRNSVRSPFLSYGSKVIFDRITGLGHDNSAIATACYAAAIALSFALARWIPIELPESAERWRLDAFRAGAAVYAGTFALGNNWFYRMMFVVLPLPQYRDWSRMNGKAGVYGKTGEGIAVASLWLCRYRTFEIDIVAQWLLLIFLAHGLFHTTRFASASVNALRPLP